jgi:hypothetical protein
MQISNLLPSSPDLAAMANRKGPTAAAALTAAKQGATPAAAAQSTAAMRQILAQYDVTSISPSDFSAMVQKLQQSGSLSPQDAKNLSSVRMDLDQAGVSQDQPINLVDFYRQRVAKAQQQFDAAPSPIRQQQLLATQQRLQSLEKLSAGHAHPEDVGLMATA